MFRKISMSAVFMALFTVIVCPVSVFGYKGSVHKGIAAKAIEKSKIGNSLGEIGFDGGLEHKIKGSFDDPKSVIGWIEYGSEWEDFMLLPGYPILMIYPGACGYYPRYSFEGIDYGHFYNPLTDAGFTDDDGNLLGQSLIDRGRLLRGPAGLFFPRKAGIVSCRR